MDHGDAKQRSNHAAFIEAFLARLAAGHAADEWTDLRDFLVRDGALDERRCAALFAFVSSYAAVNSAFRAQLLTLLAMERSVRPGGTVQ